MGWVIFDETFLFGVISYNLQDLVEQFPMDLVIDPTAHVSSDPVDMYNNVLLFIVKEDIRSGARNVGPTEIHIFQVNIFNSSLCVSLNSTTNLIDRIS